MNSKISIRDYLESDARSLVDIFYNTLHTICAKDYTKEQLNAFVPKERLELAEWQERWSKLAPIVAVLGEQIVGFVELDSTGLIDCFYVHHEYQGHGVGTALLNEIERRARSSNITKLYADVSITARTFFEAKGFRVTGEFIKTRNGVDLLNYVMEKPMNNLFKVNWEQTSELIQLQDGLVKRMASLANGSPPISCELISGGCSNLNFKVQYKERNTPQLLRVYLHDKTAAYREQKLAKLLKPNVPIPDVYYISELEGYTFAICEFMDGILLRDLLLSDTKPGKIMHEVGSVLAKLASHQFSDAGFFDQDLRVKPHKISEVLDYARACLKNNVVASTLSASQIQRITEVLTKSAHLLPPDTNPNLVHGDFGPENILVKQIDGKWKVSGILDWEFAFSGSVLWDVANMLRYAHKMPPEFKEEFIRELALKLPADWESSIALLNLSALLDCLKRSDVHKTPNRCADILELITCILLKLNP